MKKMRRENFYQAAGDFIKKGVNLAISPEGKSLRTEHSAGEFRAGAFSLALSLNPEPLIVPIAIANFDKRIN